MLFALPEAPCTSDGNKHAPSQTSKGRLSKADRSPITRPHRQRGFVKRSLELPTSLRQAHRPASGRMPGDSPVRIDAFRRDSTSAVFSHCKASSRAAHDFFRQTRTAQWRFMRRRLSRADRVHVRLRPASLVKTFSRLVVSVTSRRFGGLVQDSNLQQPE